ncbi:MAG: twin-arginine translocase subunit TatC [Acidobacteria bacterium]|nr:twin-arginine translocase subunit TatC [Acidobacteriota bacterium]
MNGDAATAAPEERGSEGLPEMSLLDHLTELRRRLVVSVIAFVAAMLICWGFSAQLFDLLTAPVVRLLPEDADRLAFLSLTEPFVLYLKVAAVGGLFLASPVLIYQIWMFVAPGLYRRERLYAIPVVFASVACFLLGGFFGYRVLFPVMAEFFLSLGADFRQLLTVNSLFGFLLRTLIGCALIFEWPIVVFFLARLGMLTAGGMWRNFRYAILIIFIIAAVVTPTPDFATQTILAMPMLLLYAVGILIAWAVQPRDDLDA